MINVAQTNIQLLNQLHRDGYGAADLDLVRDAYRLAIVLFSGQYRASGKTFIAHLVGTASTLGLLRVDITLVAAGLLHAAYQSGDFGDRMTGMTEAKRAHVRAALRAGDDAGGGAGHGASIEAHVAAYQSLPWGSRFIGNYHDAIDSMGPPDRAVLLMRLANELEEYLDLGILYHGDVSRQAMNRAHGDGRVLIAISERLGYPALAASLVEAFAAVATAEADFGPGRREADARNHSFQVAPQSCQRILDSLAARRRGAAPSQ